MTIHDTRLRNLQLLIEHFGSIVALSNATGVSEKYLSQVMNRTRLPSGNPKNIGSNVARRLEQGANMPAGWMDITQEIHAATTPSISPQEAELLRLYREASKDKRRGIIAVARLRTTD